MERWTQRAAIAVLSIAALVVLARVHDFALDRFFTVDEYQYGHATWLVSQGNTPYVDFFEHHFPLSYVLHAPVLWGDASFTDKALRLRKIVFGYLLLLSVVLAVTTSAVTRRPTAGLLMLCVPLSFGFSLMSSVDYRSDIFGSAYFLMCAGLLEANRRWRRRGIAVVCGLLLGFAILMTQKMVVQGGLSVALLWAIDRLRATRFWREGRFPGAGDCEPLLVHWVPLVATTACVGAAALAVGAWAGMLGPGFEITILQAIQHERFHDQTSVLKFVDYFWEATRWSTTLLAAAAALFLVRGRNAVWTCIFGVAVAAVVNVKAHYPYNFVHLCLVTMICAVRGGDWLFEAARSRFATSPALRAAAPLLYLLPLPLLSPQLAFVAHASSNAHQLEILQKIEKYSGEDDVVIDNAGGAMFRTSASYYFMHGEPHRLLFAEYFRTQLLEDYRESGALFWIWDFRYKKLPRVVQEYLARQYLRIDGDLHVLGFVTPPTRGVPHRRRIEVVREDDYFVHRFESREGELPGTEGILIDGEVVHGEGLHLERGFHEIEVLPNAAGYIISPLPRDYFDERVRPDENLRYTKIFEYGAEPRTARP